MSVTPRGMSIQEAYREYCDGNFRVNRQYQRKLVWSLEEKKKLIDSILKGFPIPLILLATRTLSDGTREFEILDGMQRLHAIFSYIENRFSFEDKFFDVVQLSRARQQAEEGVFTVATNEPDKLLEANACANLLDYTLAVTEFPAVDQSAVNEVFGRINAYGRRLSSQESRQAGVISPFANTIREVAAEIRGDVSSESLDLSEMPEISVDISGTELGYGIRAEDTFWCKQGILRRSQLREGEDEQLLADLAISILNQEPFAFSGANLNNYYDSNTTEYVEVNNRLTSYGKDALKNGIVSTISILRNTIEDVDNSGNALRRIIHPDAGSNPIKTGFYSVFLAFFELCVSELKSPVDSAGIIASITNLQSRLHVAAGQIRTEPRRLNINMTKGLIQPYFEEREPAASQLGPGLTLRFENALRRSQIETAAFECKQGLLGLGSERNINPDLLRKIVETVCGIANIGPESSGALFIGVADKDADVERIKIVDKVTPMQVGRRFVVGVDRELTHINVDLEAYKNLLVKQISNSQLSNPLKTDVLSNIDCIDYRGMSVICIWIQKQSQLSHLNDDVFIREGSSTKKVTGFTETKAVMSRFE